jgi:hypothetical protein
MVMINTNVNWAKLARAIGREDLISDAEFGSFVHRLLGDILVVQKYLTRIGFNQTHNHIKGGGFSGAVWPEQPDNLALPHFETHIIHHTALTVYLYQIFCF